jgi:hypothetical protein
MPQFSLAASKGAKTRSGSTKSVSRKSVQKSGSAKRLRRSSGKRSRRRGRSVRVRGQQAIQPQRVREIQEALIREHYLSGEPSGVWDSSTKDALVKFQLDNGWQSKVVPDSRALIRLGLGPNHDGLLNPDSAVVSPHEFAREKDIPGGSNEAK